MAFNLTSPSFEHEHEIPARHTCDGADVSPALVWTDPPRGTKGFALIVDDPDAPDPRAPKRTWVHWVLYDLPADARALAENASRDDFPRGTVEGENDWKEIGWRGPSPPVGRHRYFFKLHALDTSLEDLGGGASKQDLENAMMGHILATATLVGTYRRRKG
ncbi:MAG: YbhB/YbcL family Raf kinase inhibitor-like protein [Labilithrix sp.]|nr:YbhB/YbcL family Raf kinase inhibitor-like protein [Labilithrix sp.]MCW5832545.1 YbhB/YbcL family Raf kinase inhibitor-like protein [Labilithrix sp.]